MGTSILYDATLCIGCKLCEEVCGWEGVYIMPGREKPAFLDSLGYSAEDAA